MYFLVYKVRIKLMNVLSSVKIERSGIDVYFIKPLTLASRSKYSFSCCFLESIGFASLSSVFFSASNLILS